MKHSGIYRIIALFIVFFSLHINAQVTGVVYDSKSRKPLDFVNVYYKGAGIGGQTDAKGRFVIRESDKHNELTVSSVGYVTQTINLKPGNKKNLVIRLVPESRKLDAVTVTAKKKRYSRKDNPAVTLMQNVIANKGNVSIKSKDYCSYTKYEKLKFSLNEVTEEMFAGEKRKSLEFVKDHIEVCPETGKKILPITIDETYSEVYYRKSPSALKTIVKAESSKGVSELVNTGEILTSTLKDVFADVDIYDNECRLLQTRFKSPIADNAVGFYRYYLEDTLLVDNDKVIQLGFTPNNPQDFGFSGKLFVMADSSYQVRRVELSIPSNSDVNFVENMFVRQDYRRLPSGELVVVSNDMLVEISVAEKFGKAHVMRTTRFSDHSFAPVPDEVFKRVKGDVWVDPNARIQTEQFWSQIRKVELTESESKMGRFISSIQEIKGFKYFIMGVKVLMENFVETSDSLHTNKFDIGPLNTTVTYNHYDKWRFRASGLTTAHFHPHLFFGGYVSYGTDTKNVYGRLDVTYAFNKREYQHKEFPRHNVAFSYMNDVMSPFDKFLPTDKDNVFVALKSGDVDQFNHVEEYKLRYEREWENGFGVNASLTRTSSKPVDALFYQQLGTGTPDASGVSALPDNNPDKWVNGMKTSEVKVGVSYEPGATYVNTKQRRLRVNQDAPIYTLNHTIGVDGLLGSNYSYHVTELGVYKRVWLGSWGNIDTDIKGGVQWSKVPFPLLIHPAANQSYIIEDNMFSLIGNLEFLNDRYVSLMTSWDMNGKIFNRIPLLRRLKWREMIGVNVLWGALSDKNNPASSNYTDKNLFYFPGHFMPDGSYECNTFTMDPKTPYVELRLGVHNIFKLLHVEYVRRLTYRDHPDVGKQGLRIMFKVKF